MIIENQYEIRNVVQEIVKKQQHGFGKTRLPTAMYPLQALRTLLAHAKFIPWSSSRGNLLELCEEGVPQLVPEPIVLKQIRGLHRLKNHYFFTACR